MIFSAVSAGVLTMRPRAAVRTSFLSSDVASSAPPPPPENVIREEFEMTARLAGTLRIRRGRIEV
jgi:hypothetical protein